VTRSGATDRRAAGPLLASSPRTASISGCSEIHDGERCALGEYVRRSELKEISPDAFEVSTSMKRIGSHQPQRRNAASSRLNGGGSESIAERYGQHCDLACGDIDPDQ
jgi:hypothetical protein